MALLTCDVEAQSILRNYFTTNLVPNNPVFNNVNVNELTDSGTLLVLGASQLDNGAIFTDGNGHMTFISGSLNMNYNQISHASIDAGEITSGTIPLARLPSSLLTNGQTGIIVGGNITASYATNSGSAATTANFSGSLSGNVTGTQSATVIASVPLAALPGSVVTNGNAAPVTFTGGFNSSNGVAIFSSSNSVIDLNFIGTQGAGPNFTNVFQIAPNNVSFSGLNFEGNTIQGLTELVDHSIYGLEFDGSGNVNAQKGLSEQGNPVLTNGSTNVTLSGQFNTGLTSFSTNVQYAIGITNFYGVGNGQYYSYTFSNQIPAGTNNSLVLWSNGPTVGGNWFSQTNSAAIIHPAIYESCPTNITNCCVAYPPSFSRVVFLQSGSAPLTALMTVSPSLDFGQGGTLTWSTPVATQAGGFVLTGNATNVINVFGTVCVSLVH